MLPTNNISKSYWQNSNLGEFFKNIGEIFRSFTLIQVPKMYNIKFTFMCFELYQQNFAKAEKSSSSIVAKYNDTNHLHFEL